MAAVPWIAFALRTPGKKNNFYATETRERDWRFWPPVFFSRR
jgi:hypothetical protein